VTVDNSTHPGANIIIARITNRTTIIEEVTGAGHQEGVCSPTAGRLEMIKEVIEHAKELKKLLHIRDIPKMSQEVADVGLAPTMSHALQDSAGQPR